MEQNKTTKYFKYAFGEIILVVIGILIALQINNWNETKANEEKIASTLKQLQLDLLNDMQKITTVSSYTENNIRYSNMFLKNEKPRSYYEDNFFRFAQLNLNYSPFYLNKESFSSLKNQINVMPKKYKHLMNELNQLYVEAANIWTKSQNIALDEMFGYKTKLYNTYNWIEDYDNSNYTPAVKLFFLNSEINRRQLVKTNAIFGTNFNILRQIKHQSLLCYLAIRAALNDQSALPEFILKMGILHNKNNRSEYIGNYTVNENLAFTIGYKYNTLVIINPRGNPFENTLILREVGKDSLKTITSNTQLLKFERDSMHKIKGYYSIRLETNRKSSFRKKSTKE